MLYIEHVLKSRKSTGYAGFCIRCRMKPSIFRQYARMEYTPCDLLNLLLSSKLVFILRFSQAQVVWLESCQCRAANHATEKA